MPSPPRPSPAIAGEGAACFTNPLPRTMPIYEYQCEKCRHHLEALQKISDKPLRECPECGKHTLKRLLSAPLFRLAGSGWYETDFKSDKEQKRNLAGRDEAPAEESSNKEAAATETKSEKSEKSEERAGEKSGDKSGDRSAKKNLVTRPAMKAGAAAKPKAKSKPASRKTVKKKSMGRR
jgi:putative FmdB family regulatory protein